MSAPRSPTAFGLWKIQFCQAVRRPKIFVSIFSGPANRRLASIPVSASGESDVRSSTATRISSSQSKSSGAKVTRPASSAASGSKRPSCSITSTAPSRVQFAHRELYLLLRVVEHVASVGGEQEFEQVSGEAASGLCEREEALGRKVQAAQHARHVEQRLAPEPVVAVRHERLVYREHVVDVARRAQEYE